MARHQRTAPPVEDEDAACAALGVARASPVTSAGAGLPSHNLTTRVPVRPVSCPNRHVCERTFESLEPRKHPRVDPRRMVQGGSDGSLLSRAGQHGPSELRPASPSLQEGSLTMETVPHCVRQNLSAIAMHRKATSAVANPGTCSLTAVPGARQCFAVSSVPACSVSKIRMRVAMAGHRPSRQAQAFGADRASLIATGEAARPQNRGTRTS